MRILNSSTLDATRHTVAPNNHLLMHCCRYPESTGVSRNSVADLLRRLYGIRGDSALFQASRSNASQSEMGEVQKQRNNTAVFCTMQSEYRYWHYYDFSKSYSVAQALSVCQMQAKTQPIR